MAAQSLLIIDPHHHFRRSARDYLLRCREFRSVETAASYNEGLLLYAQYFPDLILIDSAIFSADPAIIGSLEKLKHSNPQLDVLALLLFEEDHPHRCRPEPPLISGVIYKESFAEGLYKYLASRKEGLAGEQAGSCRGVD